MGDILLEATHLKKYYGKNQEIKAVDDVSLQIHEGRSLALIGESGSGKTTIGKLISHLEPCTEGKIRFQGVEIQNMKEKQFRSMRKDLQIVFQSSSGVFDPAYTIGESIAEVINNYESLSARETEDRIDEVLWEVGLEPELKKRSVRALSGGQLQRANIARALVLRPKLVVCDEPVSSLDYSIRKQILNLLNTIQEKNHVTYLLITHDLSNVPYVCDEVAIMHKGKIVEHLDSTENIGERVEDSYSKLLYRSIPVPNPHLRKHETV